MDWNDRYAVNPRAFGEEPHEFVRSAFTRGPLDRAWGVSARILCPGDGYGRNGVWIASLGHEVTGLDLVASAVQDANERAAALDVTYIAEVADLNGPPPPTQEGEPFDAVVSVWFRLSDRMARSRYNQAAWNSVRPGGQVVIVAGQRVTSSTQEMREWPDGIAWTDRSIDDEVRLIGRSRR